MPATYAAFRDQASAPPLSLISGSLSSGGSFEISIQWRNRAGRNLPSSPQTIAPGPGQGIRITLPADRQAAEDIHFFEISVLATPGDLTSIRRIAWYRGLDPDQQTQRALPAVVDLVRDAHIEIGSGQTVPDLASLPSGLDLLPGMIRQVTDTGSGSPAILEYDDESAATVDNENVFPAATGRWLRTFSFSTYIGNATDLGGSRRDITGIPADFNGYILPPPYAPGSGPSAANVPVKYWWYMSASEGGAITQQGTLLGFVAYLDGLLKSQAVTGAGILGYRFNGYARLSDGTLDTSDMATDADKPVVYGKPGAFALQKDLPSGYAAQFEIFLLAEGAGELLGASEGSRIQVALRRYDQAGAANPLSPYFDVRSEGIGGVVFLGHGGDRRAVPGTGLSLKVLGGATAVGELVTRRDVPMRTVTGLIANTAGQTIAIDGNGAAYLSTDGEVGAQEAIRAIASTAAGAGPACPPSDYSSVAGGSLLTVTITNNLSVRPDYPEPSGVISVVAGSAEGEFNPLGVSIYLQRSSDGEIRLFTGFAAAGNPTQVFQIVSWGAGSVIPSVPDPPSENFSLYRPSSAAFSTAPGSSDFVADDYRVLAAYSYDGGQVTSIQHEREPGEPWLVELESPAVLQGPIWWRQGAAEPVALRQWRGSFHPGMRVPIYNSSASYYWDAASVAPDNGVEVLQVTGIEAGRFRLVQPGILEADVEAFFDRVVTDEAGFVVVNEAGNVVLEEGG